MEVSHIRLQADRPSNVFDGKLVFARLGGNHAEKMDRIGMIRLGGENPPIDLLGSLQPTALMVLDRNRQCFGNCRHKFPRTKAGAKSSHGDGRMLKNSIAADVVNEKVRITADNPSAADHGMGEIGVDGLLFQKELAHDVESLRGGRQQRERALVLRQ